MVHDSVCTNPCERQKIEIEKSPFSQTARIDSEKKTKQVVRALTVVWKPGTLLSQ
jgi:hypothetical protein